jgi:hypothetical protein
MITKQLKDYTSDEIHDIMTKNGYEVWDDDWMFYLYSPSHKIKPNMSEEFLTSEFLYAIKWLDLLSSLKIESEILFKITEFVLEDGMEEPYGGSPDYFISNVLTHQYVDENYFLNYFKYISNNRYNEKEENIYFLNLELNPWGKTENMSDKLKVFMKLKKIKFTHKEDEVRG